MSGRDVTTPKMAPASLDSRSRSGSSAATRSPISIPAAAASPRRNNYHAALGPDHERSSSTTSSSGSDTSLPSAAKAFEGQQQQSDSTAAGDSQGDMADEEKDDSFATLKSSQLRSQDVSKIFADQPDSTAASSATTATDLDLSRLLSSFAGRPASIDLHGNSFEIPDDDEDDERVDLGSLSGPSSRAAAAAAGPPKIERLARRDVSRDRTFPAPLFLKSDIAPLNIPKRPLKQTPPQQPLADLQSPIDIPTPTSSHSSIGEELSKSLGSLSQSTANGMPKLSRRSSIMYNISPAASTHVSPNTSFRDTGSTSHIPPDVTPIGPQALLLYVMSLRSASAPPMSASQSHGPPSRSGTPVANQSHQKTRSEGATDNQSAENETGPGRSTPSRSNAMSPVNVPLPVSTTKLDVVDLSQKRIAELPVEVVEQLKDEVEKLALGYNFLRELPPSFRSLGKSLKYLNIRVNYFTAFPDMLCDMPSLEILDISRNKIKKLPRSPGTLTNLKVFSIAKNRLRRLPNWIGHMSQLKMLKVDHNPLEWPPKDISLPALSQSTGSGSAEAPSKKVEAEESRQWLATLQAYLRDNPDGLTASSDRRPRASSTANEHSDDESTVTLKSSSSQAVASQVADMSRTTSGRDLASLTHSRTRTPTDAAAAQKSGSPTPLQSPAKQSTPIASSSHSRNTSLSPRQAKFASPVEDSSLILRSKKSLPDLRQAQAEDFGEAADTSQDSISSGLTTKASQLFKRIVKQPSQTLLKSAATLSETGMSIKDSNDNPLTTLRPSVMRAQTGGPPPSKSSFFRVPGTPPATAAKVEFSSPGKLKNGDLDNSPAGFDRNSGAYFRRLSMLPPSTISKAVSPTLLTFADAMRGILFALSQVYTALRQFVVFASQDRLPAPLAKLMGSADGSMSLLINALDRFDSLSRRGTPDRRIVEDIFKHGRDNVAIFHKLVTALLPELNTLIGTADVRYSRTLLLMMYGSMAEIANSWSTVVPLLSEITDNEEQVSLQVLMSPTHPISQFAAQEGSAALLAAPRSAAGSNGLLRTRSKTRRHAGSFSVEDVQIGAGIPPAEPVPALPAIDKKLLHRKSSSHSLISSMSDGPPPFDLSAINKYRPTMTTTSKSVPRLGLTTKLPIPATTFAPGDVAMRAFDQPLTPGVFDNVKPTIPEPMPAIPSGTSAGTSSSVLGPSVPVAMTESPTTLKPPALPRSETSRSVSKSSAAPITPAQRAANDEAFLAMVESTTSIAFDIYGLVLDSIEAGDTIANDARRAKEVTDLCIVGNEVTTKLKGAWGRVRGPDGRATSFTPAQAKKLGDEAYSFVQTVIRFAKLVKAISLEQPFPSRLREGVGQLTIATREFARTLSNTQTSFRPTITSNSSSSSGASGKDKAKDRDKDKQE